MTDKLYLKEAVIVEGRYDRIRLSEFIASPVIETGGFRVFKDKEKQALIRAIADRRGILVMTDVDSAGFVIRNFLRGIVPQDKLLHAYIPSVKGKERRKAEPSKEGMLGVEGLTRDLLIAAIQKSGAHILPPFPKGGGSEAAGGFEAPLTRTCHCEAPKGLWQSHNEEIDPSSNAPQSVGGGALDAPINAPRSVGGGALDAPINAPLSQGGWREAPGGSENCSLITKSDFYSYGLSGTPDASTRRDIILSDLGLPKYLTPNAMLQALNCLFTKEEFESYLDNLQDTGYNINTEGAT